MDAITAVTPPSGAALAPSFDGRPDLSSAKGGADRKALDPAVSLDLSPRAAKAQRADSERQGYERDQGTNALVYRVTDLATGDVVVQIPDEIVLKARVYGRQSAPPAGTLVERRA